MVVNMTQMVLSGDNWLIVSFMQILSNSCLLAMQVGRWVNAMRRGVGGRDAKAAWVSCES